MNRPFTPEDNEERFHYCGRHGRLEFPLSDLGQAKPEEAILWFDEPDSHGAGWAYVLPIDVDRE